MTYDYVENWDISASQKEKTYKNSLIHTANGYELVWGIGPYGQHKYILEYTVTNMIKQLKDSQILFWKFFNEQTNTHPHNILIEIEADFPLTIDNEKIWAFGFEGDIHFKDGKVISSNHKPFKAKDYATVLIQYPDGIFAAKDIINKTFSEIQEEAFESSDYTLVEPKLSDSIFAIIILMIVVLFHVLIFYLIYRFIKFALKQNKFTRKFVDEYNRVLPYEWDVFDLQYIFNEINLGSNNNLLTALILKWIYEGRLSIETELIGFIKKGYQAILQFHEPGIFENKTEEEIFRLFLARADANLKLTHSDYLNKWSSDDEDKMHKLLYEFTEKSRQLLLDNGYIHHVKR